MPFTNKTARILGVGMTPLKRYRDGDVGPSAVTLMVEALQAALADAGIDQRALDGLVALPSLVSERHFMIGHAVAQQAGLLPRPSMVVKTVDMGGAGPIAAVIHASHMVQHQGHKAVAVVCGDSVTSVPRSEFWARADAACAPLPLQHGNGSGNGSGNGHSASVPSPVIPHLYDRVAQWQMEQFGVTREQLAMVASLMTYQASNHPDALHRRPRPVEEVLASPPVAPVTSALECAKLADGGAAAIVVSADFMKERGLPQEAGVVVLGGGKGSGLLTPGPPFQESMFSASTAAAKAYASSGLCVHDIDWFGLYDCFPICFIRALEAVHLSKPNQGGVLVERWYRQLFGAAEGGQAAADPMRPPYAASAGSLAAGTAAARPYAAKGSDPRRKVKHVLPVNTHGGLLGFGAPWEVPAMHSLIEGVRQLRGQAAGRQVPGARRALVYGNGGVFSSSAVLILEQLGAALGAGEGSAKL